eukprot:scaffold202130_cov22-Tisochrysis_lutea.AAC.2
MLPPPAWAPPHIRADGHKHASRWAPLHTPAAGCKYARPAQASKGRLVWGRKAAGRSAVVTGWVVGTFCGRRGAEFELLLGTDVGMLGAQWAQGTPAAGHESRCKSGDGYGAKHGVGFGALRLASAQCQTQKEAKQLVG